MEWLVEAQPDIWLKEDDYKKENIKKYKKNINIMNKEKRI
jgi:hypothetical protein